MLSVSQSQIINSKFDRKIMNQFFDEGKSLIVIAFETKN